MVTDEAQPVDDADILDNGNDAVAGAGVAYNCDYGDQLKWVISISKLDTLSWPGAILSDLGSYLASC